MCFEPRHVYLSGLFSERRGSLANGAHLHGMPQEVAEPLRRGYGDARRLINRSVALRVAMKILVYEFGLGSTGTATRAIQVLVCHMSLGSEHLWGGHQK